jgi:hypothetical protein
MSGTDVTTDMASIFTYNAPATFESGSDTTYWSVTVDNSADTLVAGDVYVWALTALYYGAPTTLYTTTTPFVVMEKIVLFDASPYAAVVDSYLEMADPYIQTHFFDFFTLNAIIFFCFFPGIMSLG